MEYAKWTLIIVGVVILLMGIMGAIPTVQDMFGVPDPIWHAALKIIIGLVAIAVGVMEKKG